MAAKESMESGKTPDFPPIPRFDPDFAARRRTMRANLKSSDPHLVGQ
jgi:hypothetical protein